MLPYPPGMAALDYAGYQRGIGMMGNSSSPLPSLGTLGVNVGASSITHSWLVPTQCAVPYKQLTCQPQTQQQIEPGHVFLSF